MLRERSQEKELIDLSNEYFTEEEYIDCLKKLFLVNQLLGFLRSTIKTLQLLPNATSLLDVGCGGGMFILHLSKYFPDIKMTGIDISPSAINDAEKSRQQWLNKNPDLNVVFHLQEKPQLYYAENSFDIIITTLVCHHLSDDELVEFLKQMHSVAKNAVIIHDLHRHIIAHWFYKLTSCIFRNRLITHDGLISIRRGFIRNEWLLLLKKAGIQHYQLKWCFPFRWQLILLKD